MDTPPSSWTSEDALRTFLLMIVRDIYKTAAQSADSLRDAAYDPNPHRIRDRVIELQVGVVSRIFSLIDGTSAPSDWPGIKLVHGVTGEVLSDNLAWDFSAVEGAYLDASEPSPDAA